MLAKDALEESRLANDLRFVEDGEELMDYLRRRGKYADPADVAAAGPDPARPEHAAEGRPRGAAGDQGRPGPAAHPGRRPDDVEGRGGHLPDATTWA